MPTLSCATLHPASFIDMIPSVVNTAVEELIVSFNELNPGGVDELYEEPSPLEFMRYVSRNTPFIVRGGANAWKASLSWDAEYLQSALSGHTVNVAVTPSGYVGTNIPLLPGQTSNEIQICGLCNVLNSARYHSPRQTPRGRSTLRGVPGLR